MPISEARKKANKKWNDANIATRYDRVPLILPKGCKAELQAHAAERGESLNGFVNRAVREAVERDEAGR